MCWGGLRGGRAGYSGWQGSRWGWAPSTLVPTGPPAPSPSGRPALSSQYNEEHVSIQGHVPRPEEPPPNPPFSGPSQSSKPPQLMPRCSALSLLGSESPLRGRKSSPKALHSVLKPPSRIYKLFCTLHFTPTMAPLLQGITEMCSCHKDSSRSRAPALNPLARAGFLPPCFPDSCSPGLLGLVQLGWSLYMHHETKAVLSTPWSSNESQLHLIAKHFPNAFPNVLMKTFLLPLDFSILETSSVKYVLSPMETPQINQSLVPLLLYDM